MTESRSLLVWLRASAESTRLRLLALCAHRELSVSDLAQALGQSEPRVSRHLRILTEAGLLERVRQGQWVQYRLASGTAAATFIRGVLGQLDRADPALSEDRHRAESPLVASPSLSASRLGRALRQIVETDAAPRPSAVLLIGIESEELLVSAASLGGSCTAVAQSRRAAQAARSTLERERLACRVVLAGGPEVLGGRELERRGERFDVVMIDHLAAPDGALAAWLRAGRRALADSGQLWLFERYESLQAHERRVVEHPIARLRRVLADTGLRCQRIRPIEADGRHVLAALAVPETAGVPLSRAG